MNDESRFHLHPFVVVLAAIALIAVGAAVTYLAMKGGESPSTAPAGTSASPAKASPQGPHESGDGDVIA